jgi:hypothetical protein
MDYPPTSVTFNTYTPNPNLQPNHQTTQFHTEQQPNRTNFAQAFSKGLKLEFPRFDGDNPVGWLGQAEKCFTLAATPLDQRVHLAEIFLTGKVDHWLRSTGVNTDELSWLEFASMISNRFAAKTSLELIDSFKHTDQNSYVSSYIDTFEEHMGKIRLRNP